MRKGVIIHEGQGSDSTTRREKHKLDFLKFCVVFCFLCVILFFLFACIYYAYKIILSLASLSHDHCLVETFDYYENERLCDKENKYLLHPQNQTEEDLIIDDINSNINPNCKFVFFGFVADAKIRYQSLSEKTTWPSLRISDLPFDFNVCYEVKLTNSTVISKPMYNCGNQIGQNLLFLSNTYNDIDDGSSGEFCSQYRFKCLNIYRSLSNATVKDAFRAAKEKNPKLLSLVPFDRDHSPEFVPWRDALSVTVMNETDNFIVMAIKYKFVYKYHDQEQQYTSRRFAVVDPEYDCVGYNIKRKKVLTKNCGDLGCLFCSNQSKVEEEL